MYSEKRSKHGILHRLAEEAGRKDSEFPSPLGRIPIVPRRRGRPSSWSRIYPPNADAFLGQLSRYREVLIDRGQDQQMSKRMSSCLRTRDPRCPHIDVALGPARWQNGSPTLESTRKCTSAASANSELSEQDGVRLPATRRGCRRPP